MKETPRKIGDPQVKKENPTDLFLVTREKLQSLVASAAGWAMDEVKTKDFDATWADATSVSVPERATHWGWEQSAEEMCEAPHTRFKFEEIPK